MKRQLFIGPIIQTNDDGKLLINKNAGILVENGKIIKIYNDPNPSHISAEIVTHLKEGQFFIPGFIDCHIHAVQLPNLGIGYDRGLLDWLETYTFPLEKKYKDKKFSEKVFDAVVKRTLAVGTTTACYFASLYGESSMILAQKAAHYHQRAFIGKVNMDCARSDNYFETTKTSLENTKNFIQEILNIGSPLIKPIITPRFALSCSMELMKELGKIAQEFDIPIQTHISENSLEIKTVKAVYPNCATYSDVYNEAGLLTNKTLLAHGVHLEDSELEILKFHRSSVVHCPSSNTCLKSGLCDIQRLKSHGITVGLGTDVSGGQSICILDAMRAALEVSAHLEMIKSNSYKSIDYIHAFYLATLGGAKCLSIDDQVGSLTIGKQFDALVIDLCSHNGPLDNLTDHTLEEKLQRLIYSGDDRNIVQVYVSGHRVK
ncbi:guanine deaminase [Chelonus insularis]|uniref:guanine deaminase n=1 Tax=Chelonus insularis TaxID=460826 RepID=UPI00158D4C1F|nr:guanine deaminase [Chelonus insularis]